MLFWIVTYNNQAKSGWTHSTNGLDNALIAISYQTGITQEQFKQNDAKVRFLYRDGIDLGTYYYECQEFYPSSFYDDNPNVADL